MVFYFFCQLRFAGFHYFSLNKNMNNVGFEIFEDTLIVGDDDNAGPTGSQKPDPMRHNLERIHVQPCIYLVKNRKSGGQYERLKHLYLFLLSTRKSVVDAAGKKRFINGQLFCIIFYHQRKIRKCHAYACPTPGKERILNLLWSFSGRMKLLICT